MSTTQLRGITEYEPAEYTITVRAGTPVSEVAQALKAGGQYLPFDPMLAGCGATVGGTVASGFSGPRRFRYGGLRDFLLGARFVDGNGKLLTAGGKVVKNAAGFDFPKLLIGSLGTLGILTELTFKVFPEPQATRTLRVSCQTHQEAAVRMRAAARSRWELDSLDYRVTEKRLFLRVQGTEKAATALARDVQTSWPGHVTLLSDEEAAAFWQDVRECQWTGGAAAWIKAPLTLEVLPALANGIDEISEAFAHISAGGAVAWIASETAEATSRIGACLRDLELSGLCFRGDTPCRWLGCKRDWTVAKAVKKALDPPGRFPDLQD